MEILKYYIGAKSALNSLPKSKGQIIVTDTKEIYTDIDNSTRIKLGYSTDEIDFLLSGKLSPPANDDVLYGIKNGEWTEVSFEAGEFGIADFVRDENSSSPFNFWIGTQDEYEAILVKDNQTIYMVK